MKSLRKFRVDLNRRTPLRSSTQRLPAHECKPFVFATRVRGCTPPSLARLLCVVFYAVLGAWYHKMNVTRERERERESHSYRGVSIVLAGI